MVLPEITILSFNCNSTDVLVSIYYFHCKGIRIDHRPDSCLVSMLLVSAYSYLISKISIQSDCSLSLVMV